jgi:hypothetical protein
MRVNVVARGSLASSAAETRTGATAACAWAVWRPGWWLHPLSPAASTAAPAPASATRPASAHRRRPGLDCRAARPRPPSPAGPRLMPANRPMRRNRSRVNRPS